MTHEWYKWYPAIYKADTAHLTAEQDGIYRRLIDHYMETRQPLMNNDVALARIAGVSIDAWAIAAAILLPYFIPSEDGLLRHKFCDAQLKEQDKTTKKQSQKGKTGAAKRWGKAKEKQDDNSSCHATAIAEAKPRHNHGANRGEEIREEENSKVITSEYKISSSSSNTPGAQADPPIDDDDDELILIFEEEREKVFGTRRTGHRKDDLKYARDFRKLGADTDMIRKMFHDGFQRCFDSSKDAPGGLAYFQNEITSRLNANKPTAPVKPPEPLNLGDVVNPEWRVIVENLRKHLTDPVIRAWVLPIRFLKNENAELHIEVKNRFMHDEIAAKFASYLKAAAGAQQLHLSINTGLK